MVKRVFLQEYLCQLHICHAQIVLKLPGEGEELNFIKEDRWGYIMWVCELRTGAVRNAIGC